MKNENIDRTRQQTKNEGQGHGAPQFTNYHLFSKHVRQTEIFSILWNTHCKNKKSELTLMYRRLSVVLLNIDRFRVLLRQSAYAYDYSKI